MNCPYFEYCGNCWIKCRRGYSTRYWSFTQQHKMDKHIETYCNGNYVTCRNYEKLENDWGKEKIS